jgi:predicted PurR-regulated permease PerM
MVKNTHLDAKSLRSFVFYAILALIAGGIFWNFTKDYLTPIFLGFLFATITYPIYQNLSSHIGSIFYKFRFNLSAVITMITVTALLVIILNIFITQLQREIPKFAQAINSFISDIPNNKELVKTFNLSDEQASEVSKNMQKGINDFRDQSSDRVQLLQSLSNEQNLSRAIQIGQQTVAGAAELLINLVLFYFIWFYGLTKGNEWQKAILDLFPFRKDEKEEIQKDVKMAVRNVFYANLGGGIIHATVIFLMLVVFQIPNQFIITFIVFLIGVLPVSPSEFAYAIPISLIFGKNPTAALILIPVSEAIILWVNYVFIPKIISDTGSDNTLLILLSIFSGISFFGIMGFLIGPVIMIFAISLYKILAKRLKESGEEG